MPNQRARTGRGTSSTTDDVTRDAMMREDDDTMASTEATGALLDVNPALRVDWLGFLAGFDVVFLTALWLFGEYLLEE